MTASRAIRRVRAIGVLVVALAIAACGGSGSSSVVARVGSASITQATLAQWTAVTASEDAASDPTAETSRQRALSYLISSDWYIGEAAEAGEAVSPQEVARRFRANVRAYKNGQAEFQEVLKLTRQTSSGVEFRIEAELASAKVHQLAVRNLPQASQAQVASYYNSHKRSYVVAEKRQVRLVHTESKAAAEKVERQASAGKRVASDPESESLVYSKGLKGGTRTILAKTIFLARRGVATGPIRVGPNYFVFELIAVTPAVQETVAEVGPSIEEALNAQARKRAVAAFFAAWRTKWTARTSCRAGFVVRECRQYTSSAGGSGQG